MLHRYLLPAACVAGLLSLTACDSGSKPTSGTPETLDADFDAYKQRFIDSLWYYNPEWASGAGFHRYDSVLVVPSVGRRQTEAAARARRRQEMLTYPVAQLSVNNQTDYRLMENYLASADFYADSLRDWQWNPASYNVGGSVAEILNGRYQPLERRLRAISHKLIQVTDYYEAAKQNLERPTREHTNLAIRQTQGGLAVFGPALLDSVAKSGLTAAEKQELQGALPPPASPWKVTCATCKRRCCRPVTSAPSASGRPCSSASSPSTSRAATRPTKCTARPWPTSRSCCAI